MINQQKATTQRTLFENIEDAGDVVVKDSSSTFADNMTLPVHKWFRYTAGFSASWVNQLIKEQKLKNNRSKIIEPFAGSGTVLLESEFENVEAIGLEAHPYIHRIAKAKLLWRSNHEVFFNAASKLLNEAKELNQIDTVFPELIHKCYTEENLFKLASLRAAWFGYNESEDVKTLLWFLITSILRPSSHVGTAQWQYVLPNQTKAKRTDPYKLYSSKLEEMVYDMKLEQGRRRGTTRSKILLEDARKIESIEAGWGDLVITSPPYANNYDYADATRLELCFWGDIKGWKDLQLFIRGNLIRACTQHVGNMKNSIDSYLNDPLLSSIADELNSVYNLLQNIRIDKGGKKNYHFMIVSYFKDMCEVFYSLRKATSPNALMCFVIGDSAPYGIYVPVDRWLGTLAVSAGFEKFNFEKLRDRNIKWKNRKHTVPLKEGRLWIS